MRLTQQDTFGRFLANLVFRASRQPAAIPASGFFIALTYDFLGKFKFLFFRCLQAWVLPGAVAFTGTGTRRFRADLAAQRGLLLINW